MSGRLFVVSGPSGAGKGTLLAWVLGRMQGIWESVSATTRPARKGETDGLDYYFLSDESFDALIAENGLLEWAEVYGHRYGTPRESVFAHLAAGEDVLLEIDPQGAQQIRQSYPDAALIFIVPPSLEILEERLRSRGTESEAQIALRLTAARAELKEARLYDVVIVNDEIERAGNELLAVIEASRSVSDQGPAPDEPLETLNEVSNESW